MSIEFHYYFSIAYFSKKNEDKNKHPQFYFKSVFFRETWPRCLAVNAFGVPAEDLTPADLDLASSIGEFYFGTRDPDKISLEDNFRNLTNFFTDAVFAHGSELMVK